MYAGVKILLHLFAAVKDKVNTSAHTCGQLSGRALSGGNFTQLRASMKRTRYARPRLLGTQRGELSRGLWGEKGDHRVTRTPGQSGVG